MGYMEAFIYTHRLNYARLMFNFHQAKYFNVENDYCLWK